MKKAAGLFFVLSLILALSSCAPVTIETTPSGAAVIGADGKTLGTTPYKTSVFTGNKSFDVRKDRYFDEPVKLDYASPRIVDVKLRAKPVLVYSKPIADIYQAGSAKPVGRTPMEIEIFDTSKTLTLKTANYNDRDVTIGSESPDTVIVELVHRPIVTISATPAGTEVFENGKRIGATPLKQEILKSRTFELRKEGYFSQNITLTDAPPYEVAVELKAFPIVNVTVTPAGAKFYKENKQIGKSPAKFAVGKKTVLEVRADRYYPQSITLTPESPSKLDVALKAMPYVMIKSEPADAEVFIGGKSVGKAPIEQLIEKPTAVELRKEGFVTKTVTLTGADKQVSTTLEKVPEPVAPQPVATSAVPAAAVSAPKEIPSQQPKPAVK